MGKGKGARARTTPRTHHAHAPNEACDSPTAREPTDRATRACARAHLSDTRVDDDHLLTMVCSRALMHAGMAVPQFDLATALTKKEGRVIRKAEYMIPYQMARCPNYGWKESEEYAAAEALKEKIGGIEAKAKKRWESSFI